MIPPTGQCWEFRDQVLPARLVYLLKEKKLNTKDLLLIFVVGSLVRPQGERSGIGCYASNDYLSKACGEHPTNISKRIAKLKDRKLKILIEVWHNNTRYLELTWSRTPEELDQVEGEYGEKLRVVHEEMKGKTAPKELDKGTERVGKITNPPLGKITNPPLGNFTNIYSKEEYIKDKEVEGGSPPEGLEAPSLEETNGLVHQNKTNLEFHSSPLPLPQKQTPPVPDFCIEWEKKIRKILHSRKPSVGSILGFIDSGQQNLSKLWKQLGGDNDTKDRISAVIDWLENNINNPDLNGKLPVMKSVHAFCKFFPDWIEPKMDWYHMKKNREDKEKQQKELEEQMRKDMEESGFIRTRDGRLFVTISGGGKKYIPPQDEDLYSVPKSLRRKVVESES